MLKKGLFLFSAAIICLNSYSQDLDALLDAQLGEENKDQEVIASFKSTRLITGHSVKNPSKSDLIFLISHRFGELNLGPGEFFGLDISTIRLGLEYGLTDWLAAGIGRSSYNKVVDSYFKAKIFQQKTGDGQMPVSISILFASSLRTKGWDEQDLDYLFSHRLTYTSQLLIARKFSQAISIQLSPGYIHRNIVHFAADPNDILYAGIGGRMKVSKRVSINAEYFYAFSERIRSQGFNPLSVGVDLETGGHVFQLMFSNSRGMTEAALIPETTGSWGKGDIHFGFNITRTF